MPPPTARLSTLLAAADLPGAVPAIPDPEVLAVTEDSRAVRPGSIFVAVPGTADDGVRYAAAAVRAGAVAVVAERLPDAALLETPLALVPDARHALAVLAARLAGDPGEAMVVVGVTGTDGKTTTSTMVHSAWRAAGIAGASLTTVDVRVGDAIERNPTRMTTLAPVPLQARLSEALHAGCTHVVVETSSHALALRRVDAVPFRVGVVLRVTTEHLDFHGTRANYLAAKAGLIERVATRPDGVAVLDLDDEFAFPVLRRIAGPRVLAVSAAGASAADVCATAVAPSVEGISFVVRSPWGQESVRLRVAGGFNVANAVAALAAACVSGAEFTAAVAGLGALETVPGRMERLRSTDGVTVIVDYAHTEAALDRVLTELRASTAGRLWAVFGSGGNRDRDKRPAMGAAAARHADIIVLTDEDPRQEDRETILEEIARGARAAGAGAERLRLIPDRAAAVALAIDQAAPGDVVLLAGKGHERTIEMADGPQPWDERAAAEAAIARRSVRG